MASNNQMRRVLAFCAAVVVAVLLVATLSTVEAQVSPPCGKVRGDYKPFSKTLCSTNLGMTAKACSNRNRRCYCVHKTNLKYTGTPCATGTMDGGCQCGDFCGYKCKTKCTNDPRKRCFWDDLAGLCKGRETGTQGTTGLCVVTGQPTTSPTPPTFQPTASPIIPTFQPSRGPGSSDCRPGFGLGKTACEAMITQCEEEGAPMKWGGSGCVINKKRQGDGGCQCKGYCGYKCATRCDADEECRWNITTAKCLIKATNATGRKISMC